MSYNWKVFKRDWKNYEIASKTNKEEMEIRIATFLACIGSEAMNIYDGLDISEADSKKIDKIIEAFEKHCIGETNETYERFTFNSRQQGESESVDKYVTELRKLSKTCNFDNLEESLIRDKLVTGLRCDITRRKLLQEHSLNLAKAIDIARAMEVSKTQMTKIKQQTDSAHGEAVNKVEARPKKDAKLKLCHFCSKMHILKKELCPAYGKICSSCKGRNHFANSKYCKGIRCLQIEEESVEEEASNDTNQFDAKWMYAVDSGESKSTATLEINEQKVSFLIDTGADVNTICKKFVPQKNIRPTLTKLWMWNKTKMTPIGEATLRVYNPKTRLTHPIKFIVVTDDVKCLLGIETLKALQFVTLNNDKFVSSVEASCALGDLGEAKLSVDPSVKPRQLPCRKIPFAIQSKVKSQLDTMVQRGILKPVTEPTEWVNQMAIAQKADGNIRICIDPAHLNKALQREHYKLPTLDDVLSEFKDARFFTKVDVKEAYWHIRLDEASSFLTTMITPVGRFRWLRLPFGLKVSSEIFQKKLCDSIEGLKNTANVADDIVLAGCGRTDEEAKANLKIRTQELQQRCTERNIILNNKKTVTEAREIIFMGHKITAEGICPDPKKVEAILNLPAPTDISGIKRLSGTVQYLARYIPRLSQHLEPLRNLTKKDTVWNWTSECQTAFENIKSLVIEATKLAYFDNDKDVHLQVDSSKDGVGTVLMQDGRPIEFASKTLSETQKRWAQIEKELLAVVIGLERFDQYTYGRKVFVQNDHKPLSNILKKPLSEAPRRLQTLLMRLHRYDVEFEYLEGNKLLIADTLSRAVGTEESHIIPDIRICMVSTIHDSISDPILQQIREATQADVGLQTLCSYITDGWPPHNCCPQTLPYKQIKDNLSIEDGLIYKGEQVIIPHSLRTMVKEKLHAAHLGYDSMMRRVRTTVFWPGIQHEVRQLAEQCETCQRRKPQNQKETLIQHDNGNGPWHKIGADLCEIDGVNYLIVVDYFTNYIEIEHLSTTTASQIIKKK